MQTVLTEKAQINLSSLNPSNMKQMRFFTNEPGFVFSYNETEPQILSMRVIKVTKMTALDFGNKYLFKPLGISNLR